MVTYDSGAILDMFCRSSKRSRNRILTEIECSLYVRTHETLRKNYALPMFVNTHPNPNPELRKSGPGRTMRIIIACKTQRGKTSAFSRQDMCITTDFAMLDATSGSPKAEDAIFSPLLGMEHKWQQCKFYEGINREQDVRFWEQESERFFKLIKPGELYTRVKQRNAARKLGLAKIKKIARRSKLVKKYKAEHKVYPTETRYQCEELGVETTNKTEAREKIYGPLYEKYILNGVAQERLGEWKAYLQTIKGNLTIIVKDVDGPKDRNGVPSWADYDAALHAERIKGKDSFGHGYFVARKIAEIAQEVGFDLD